MSSEADEILNELDGRLERIDAMVAAGIAEMERIYEDLDRLQSENIALKRVAHEAEVLLDFYATKKSIHLPLMVAIDDYRKLSNRVS